VGENGEQDAIHTGFVLESTHWPGPSSDFTKAPFDRIGRSNAPPLGFDFVTEAGEQLVKIVAQADNGGRILLMEAFRKPIRGGSGGGEIGRIHDLVQSPFDLGLIGFADLVEHVSDLVCPAALHRNVGQYGGQGGEQAEAPVEANHVEPFAGEPATVEISEELLPFGGAFACGQTEVDDLLFAVLTQSQSDEDRPARRRRFYAPARRPAERFGR
jgi:hypothetical protein